MSSRHMRKLFGETALPPPGDSSDEEPQFSKLKPSFQGLEVASESSASEPASSSEAEREAPPEPLKKNRNNKKKKKKAAKSATCPAPDNEDVDEVTRCLQEVNQLLGEPSPKQIRAAKPCLCTPPFMRVDLRHLNSNNEMNRKFGFDEDEKKKRRVRRSNIRLLKKFVVVPLEDYVDMFKPVGLTMSVSSVKSCACKEANVSFFSLDHSAEYQRIHRRYLYTASLPLPALDADIFIDAHRNHHVEAMIECSDLFFSRDDLEHGSEFVTQAVAYLQYVAHPAFLPTDANVRLEYTVSENRVFHVAILKYLYMLTTKACHRTALELAKVLLNLDPSDPLAVILVIDSLALRAREHEWLIQAIEHWMKERDANFMYSLRFSYALAKFHVLLKNKEDTAEATELLESALLDFPYVCHQMLHATGQRIDPRLTSHPLYDGPIQWILPELSKFYCHMSCARWKEPNVIKWFVKACTDVAEKFDTNPEYQSRSQRERQRRRHYMVMPIEMQRHFCVIKSMEELVTDNGIPSMIRGAPRTANPLPPSGAVDRYGYTRSQQFPTAMAPLHEVAVRMLTSLNPSAVPPPPPRPPPEFQ